MSVQCMLLGVGTQGDTPQLVMQDYEQLLTSQWDESDSMAREKMVASRVAYTRD